MPLVTKTYPAESHSLIEHSPAVDDGDRDCRYEEFFSCSGQRSVWGGNVGEAQTDRALQNEQRELVHVKPDAASGIELNPAERTSASAPAKGRTKMPARGVAYEAEGVKSRMQELLRTICAWARGWIHQPRFTAAGWTKVLSAW